MLGTILLRYSKSIRAYKINDKANKHSISKSDTVFVRCGNCLFVKIYRTQSVLLHLLLFVSASGGFQPALDGTNHET